MSRGRGTGEAAVHAVPSANMHTMEPAHKFTDYRGWRHAEPFIRVAGAGPADRRGARGVTRRYARHGPPARLAAARGRHRGAIIGRDDDVWKS